MKRFKNILLIYECDESTLERAAVLAKENRAKLTILHPVKDTRSTRGRLSVGQKGIDVQKLVQRELQTKLKDVANTVRALGVRPKTQVVIGDPVLDVIRDVIDNKRDLVIMMAEGRGGLRARLFGSTSSKLMRKCPSPVLVIKPSRTKRFRRILVAIDPQITGDAHDALNGLLLTIASSLAAREGGQLHIVHAWSLFGEAQMRGAFDIPDGDVDRAVRDEGERRSQIFQSVVKEHLSVNSHQLHLLQGEAAEVIPELVSRLDIDLLVMGTVCRIGLPGFIIGNTAERVLNVVECSVLTVKPEGFVSPMARQLVS